LPEAPSIRPTLQPLTPFTFEQAFKNVDDVLWKEAGCTTELDFIVGIAHTDFPDVQAFISEIAQASRSVSRNSLIEDQAHD
jgi:hypothetical protein